MSGNQGPQPLADVPQDALSGDSSPIIQRSHRPIPKDSPASTGHEGGGQSMV